MYRILYISTARVALPPEDVREILRVSRRNNERVDVTGLLVVGGRRFLQALEGPHGAVMTTYDRIAADPRHFAMVKLGEQVIEQRSFANWSMGFESGGTSSSSASLSEQIAAIVEPIADATLRAYFTGFAKTHTSA